MHSRDKEINSPIFDPSLDEGVWNPLPESMLKTHYQIFRGGQKVIYNNFILDFLGYLYDVLHK